MSKANTVRGAIVVAALFGAAPAFAYIDPGTGSILIQSGIAALLGLAFAFRNGYRALLLWFKSLFSGDDDAPPGGGTPPDAKP